MGRASKKPLSRPMQCQLFSPVPGVTPGTPNHASCSTVSGAEQSASAAGMDIRIVKVRISSTGQSAQSVVYSRSDWPNGLDGTIVVCP